MTRQHLALAALLAATAPANAGMLVPYEAESIDLGGLHGFAYYSEQPDGFRVVATLLEGEGGPAVRFEATLADRQRLTITLPGEPGEPARVVELSRTGDRLLVD